QQPQELGSEGKGRRHVRDRVDAVRSRRCHPAARAVLRPDDKCPPTSDQLRKDWHEAQKMLRTDFNLSHIVSPHAPASVLCYDDVSKVRLTDKAMQLRMAEILKKDKLRGLLYDNGGWCKSYQDFPKFPAPAQVFCLSFAYGRLPFDFPKMNAFIKDWEFAKAATECHVEK